MIGSPPDSSSDQRRREFLKAFSSSVVGLATGTAMAQGQTQEAKSSSLSVIDFHNHFVGSAFVPIVGSNAPPGRRAHFDRVNRSLGSAAALLESIETSGVAARVVNTPLEFIQDPEGDVAPDTTRRINDQLADLVSRNPGRLYGLATIDVYGGEAGARELTRAVRELGLRGAFVQAAKNELLLDAPQARPTLAAAASLGVPIFVHPITDSQLGKRLRRYGRQGVTLNRSTINSAALISLLEGGVFDELPRLRVIVTTLSIGAILLAAGLDGDRRLRRDAPELSRRHVYIDTMGLHPALIRSVVEVLGADHVLAGTDWPIYVEEDVPRRLKHALEASGLTNADQKLVAGGNTAKLLGIG